MHGYPPITCIVRDEKEHECRMVTVCSELENGADKFVREDRGGRGSRSRLQR